jgi:hypothetical protein
MALEITNIMAHFDKVHVWFEYPPTWYQMAILADLNDGNKVTGKPLTMKGPGNNKWQYSLWVVAPTAELLHYLHHHFLYRYRITRVEVAADYYATSKGMLKKLERFFDIHLIKKWVRQDKKKYKITTYLGARSSSSTLARYERVSKLNGKPCYHLELRLCKETLRRLNLQTVPGLFAFDFYAFFRKKLTFLTFQWEQAHLLGAVLVPEGKARYKAIGKLTLDQHRRYGCILARALSIGHKQVDAQGLRDYLRQKKLSVKPEIFEELDNTAFLPRSNYICAQNSTFVRCECAREYQIIKRQGRKPKQVESRN